MNLLTCFPCFRFSLFLAKDKQACIQTNNLPTFPFSCCMYSWQEKETVQIYVIYVVDCTCCVRGPLYPSSFYSSPACPQLRCNLLHEKTTPSPHPSRFSSHNLLTTIILYSFFSIVLLTFYYYQLYIIKCGLLWWLSGKESACQAGDAGLIPGLGRAPGEGNGNPLQYSCLENPKDREAWWATVHRVTKELETTQ